MPHSQSGSVVQRQTIKQAKAAYKSRVQQPISEAQRKQLERSIELDRRAWRAKEQEKRKADALNKRAEKELREKDERERVQMGSQRRCDRFGYKSSQFHLGAFFGGGGAKNQDWVPESKREELLPQVKEDFEEEGMDDESLLDALESPPTVKKTVPVLQQGRPPPRHVVPPPPPPLFAERSVQPGQRKQTEPPPDLDNELGALFDELGSSTQIARELDTEDASRAKGSRNASFNSADFDLTADDLEELDPSPQPPPAPIGAPPVIKTARQLMPPPVIPSKPQMPSARPPSRPLSARPPGHIKTLMAPPPVPCKPSPLPAKTVAGPSTFSKLNAASQALQPSGIDHHSCGGYTRGELESFVDDDLVLTQATPG